MRPRRLEFITTRTVSYVEGVDFVEDGKMVLVSLFHKEHRTGKREHRALTDEECADLELFLLERRERLKRRDLEDTPVQHKQDKTRASLRPVDDDPHGRF